jgi:Uma2 family endonuclease
MMSYTLNLEPLCQMTDEQFYQLCRQNPNVNFERNAKGELIIMSPTGGETGNINSEINAEFVIWNRKKKLGKVFDSNTCFKLPNGENRSPDVSWISLDRWNQLTLEQREKFPPIAPDFALELLSPSDNLKDIQKKMEEYMSNGVKLGWFIDRKTRIVEIYCQGKDREILTNPEFLLGEEVLPELVLDLKIVW